MKNVIHTSKKVFLMVALLVTVIGYANDKSFYISKGDAGKTTLTLMEVKKGDLFTIKNENGLILYKEAIQENGVYKKGFDLTSLPDGSYFFELDKDMEITTIPFTVKASDVAFDKSKSETVFKPLTVVRNDHLLVSQLSLEKKPLKIKIYQEGSTYSSSYELIHSETITDTKHIKRVYKLRDFSKGQYKIVFMTEGQKFVKFF
ncbi:hypothetical protein [Hyunsoonleella ulvae]|uniref:hypothetical protein n=1 Tax=Hyunsoonleella ulvae TaxID=2799948 RepID=UPI00193A924C|nr:hypothetical protein [Hyunsoonleella ulvae]